MGNSGDFNDDASEGEYFDGIPHAAEDFATSIAGSVAGIVTARGTADGLVIRLDGRVPASSLKAAIIEFLNHRKAFVSGNEVRLEWLERLPEGALLQEIAALLGAEYGVTVKGSSLWEAPLLREAAAYKEAPSFQDEDPYLASDESVSAARSQGSKRTPSLFDGVEVFSSPAASSAMSNSSMSIPAMSSAIVSAAGERTGASTIMNQRSGRPSAANSSPANVTFDSALWDDPDCRVVYGTLRSGQKIETEHSLIVFGDLNSGSEIVAGGDIVVLGTLRGIAHAGAYDETGGGRVIFALNLQPTQLRIGTTISRGNGEDGRDIANSNPEIARVENNMIIVERYSARPTGGSRTTGARHGATKGVAAAGGRLTSRKRF